MSSSVSMSAALRAQDLMWYDSEFPKEHVEYLVMGLQRLPENVKWIWPSSITEALDYMVTEIRMKFGDCYSRYEMLGMMKKLYARFSTHQKLMRTDGMTWDMNTNRFTAVDEQVWEKLLQEDTQCAWYYSFGDPMWADLGTIFEGDKFNHAGDTFDLNAAEPDESRSIKNDGCFELDKIIIPSPPRREISPMGAQYCTIPDSPVPLGAAGDGSSWNGLGSPHYFLGNRFVEPLNGSPSVADISEEEWKAARIASISKSAAKKKIVWDANSSESSTGSNKNEKGSKYGALLPKFRRG